MARRRLVMFACMVLCLAVAGCNLSTPAGVESTGEANLDASGLGKGLMSHDREREYSPCRRTLQLLGKFNTLNPTWVVSHFSERICTDGKSLVAGSRVTSKGWVEKLGESEIKVSAAWDWAHPAAGRFEPRGPATKVSASMLTEVYFFSVNPFATVDPFEPVCGDTVKAKAEVTLEAGNGDKIYGVITYGEVYELGFHTPGDGQEQFIVVHATEGTGHFEGVRGRYLIHAIFDLAQEKLLGARIHGAISVPCEGDGDRDDDRVPDDDVPDHDGARDGDGAGTGTGASAHDAARAGNETGMDLHALPLRE